MNEYRVFGLRRSGNHAIINWIVKQSGSNSIFINDHELDQPFPKFEYNKNQPIDVFVHSYEEQRFGKYHLLINEYYRNQIPLKSKFKYDILILRDPLNLFASRVKSGYTSTWRTPRLDQVDLYLLYAKEFLGRTNYLSNKIVINYNLWVESIDYRKKIADYLHLNFTDAGFNEVSEIGGGSSFENTKFNNRASEMEVNERWKMFKKNVDFRSCFKNIELLWFHKRIFGLTDEMNSFYQNNLKQNFSVLEFIRKKIKVNFYPIVLDEKYRGRNIALIKKC